MNIAKLYLLLFMCCLATGLHAQDKEHDDMARRWQQSMDAAEKERISSIKPRPFINGSHYLDSAYHIGFYFEKGDSIVNRSADGDALFKVFNGFYFMRMNTVSSMHAAATFAGEQREAAKGWQPAGATHYKVGKVKKGENEYCLCHHYTITYTDAQGKDMEVYVRVQYGTTDKVVQLVGMFPDDGDAAKKEQKLNDMANSVSMF